QRFLCQTQSYNEVWLALELLKILKEEEGVVYPRTVRFEGLSPYYTQPPPEPIVDEQYSTEPAGGGLMDMDAMFDDDGPSEEEIERFQKEASAASSSGKLKAPKIDVKDLQKRSLLEDEDEDEDDLDDDEEDDDDDFEEFDVDDLM
ncbi:hypothetical protein ACFLR1_05815, partial [Bacteroidota bacterium]